LPQSQGQPRTVMESRPLVKCWQRKDIRGQRWGSPAPRMGRKPTKDAHTGGAMARCARVPSAKRTGIARIWRNLRSVAIQFTAGVEQTKYDHDAKSTHSVHPATACTCAEGVFVHLVTTHVHLRRPLRRLLPSQLINQHKDRRTSQPHPRLQSPPSQTQQGEASWFHLIMCPKSDRIAR